ncbi:hypothetical protein HUJ05_006205 [Dendroctonus ponderosae]|nr:hypothetical protein HUJ05_006205 [Dendroctonus ponderosae]
MLKIVTCFVAFTALLGLGSVSQCYHCNSYFCGDTYNAQLGAVTSCSDLYKNAKLYSSRLINQETRFRLSSVDSDDDIETLTSQTPSEPEQGPNARVFDIKRIFWEIFNKGEIDEYTEFVCVKVNYNESSQTKTYRGCVPKATKSISTACEFVNQKVIGASTGTISSCHTCNTNLCNSGVNLGTSLLTMGVALVFKSLL